jgi:hypothetical protein
MVLAMVFTSSSAANKGNKFRIISPRATISVIMLEFVTFNILEKVLMIIPALSSQLAFRGDSISNDVLDYGQLHNETISVERVLQSLYKRSENHLQISVYEIPKKILSCRAKNLDLTQRFISDPSGLHNFAIAIYHYDVEISYLNYMGKIKQISINSGTRHEQTFVKSSQGRLNVVFNTECLYNNITLNMVHPDRTIIKENTVFKPSRLWL